MKATGIIRKLDDLGRIVIPKELIKTLGLKDKAPMEILVDDDELIILKKYHPGCAICGEISDTVEFKGKRICSNCIKGIRG